MTTRVVVLGSNFAGLTAALGLQRELHEDVAVTVLSATDRFLFTPSLIWVPFGKRTLEQITFPVGPTLDKAGVHFHHDAATEIDPIGKVVTTASGHRHDYDYLVVATGFRNDLDRVPGIGEGGNAATITTPGDAMRAADGWRGLLDEPGDVVVGATQGAGCFGAAYEFLFNTAYQLKKAGLSRRARLTYVTAEPFVGHFGIGGLPHGEALLGMFLKHSGIEVVTGAAMDSVDDGAISLTDGRTVPFRWAMVVPAFKGAPVLETVPGLTDAAGFVPVRDTYQSQKYDDIYAVGATAAVDVPWTTPVPVGIPKTGYPTERQAFTAVANISAEVRGEAPAAHQEFGDIPAVCVMDAGNNGVVILADKMLPPRKHGVLIPGPQAHAAKLAFEKYFIWKMKHGHVNLP